MSARTPSAWNEGDPVRYRVGQETVIGTVTAVNPDGTVRVDMEWRPSALIVAGSQEQALTWILEMGFEPMRASRIGGKSAVPWTPEHVGRRGGDFPRAREAFFVGTWERIPAEPLMRLWLDLQHLAIPSTHVCAPDGEILARKAGWFRWNAPSSNAATRLHLLHRAPGEEGRGPDELLVSACGLRLTAKQARESPNWHQEERWGAPPGACGVCAHELWKFPPGDFNSRKAALAQGAYNVGTLRAQQIMGETLGEVGSAAAVSDAKIEEFARVFARDMRNLAE